MIGCTRRLKKEQIRKLLYAPEVPTSMGRNEGNLAITGAKLYHHGKGWWRIAGYHNGDVPPLLKLLD